MSVVRYFKELDGSGGVAANWVLVNIFPTGLGVPAVNMRVKNAGVAGERTELAIEDSTDYWNVGILTDKCCGFVLSELRQLMMDDPQFSNSPNSWDYESGTRPFMDGSFIRDPLTNKITRFIPDESWPVNISEQDVMYIVETVYDFEHTDFDMFHVFGEDLFPGGVLTAGFRDGSEVMNFHPPDWFTNDTGLDEPEDTLPTGVEVPKWNNARYEVSFASATNHKLVSVGFAAPLHEEVPLLPGDCVNFLWPS